ncbi:MAG: alcohol dehydrogenase catalytic domain-containing protein [Actinomycetota bacterium]
MQVTAAVLRTGNGPFTVGADVTSVVPGDHVVLSFNSCGACPACAKGRLPYCFNFSLHNMSGGRPDGTSMISGRTITGVMEGDSTPSEFIPLLARLNADGKFPFHELITRFPIDQINEAEAASASGAVIKPVLTFD